MQTITVLTVIFLLCLSALQPVRAGEPSYEAAKAGSPAGMNSLKAPPPHVPAPVAQSRRIYEKEFTGLGGSGLVTVEVTEIIVFSIAITEGTGSFCNVPWKIVQNGITYNITTSAAGENDILIVWNFFDGCGEIPEGVTAAGTMSEFPSSFDIRESFRIYCGIWVHGDYFDISPAPPPGSTTSSTMFPSTTSLPHTTSTLPPCPAEYLFGEDAAATELLRVLRDDILAKTSEGRELIRLYYQLSPAMVTAIQKDPELEHTIKKALDELMGFSPPPVP